MTLALVVVAAAMAAEGLAARVAAVGQGEAPVLLGSKTYEQGHPAMWHWIGWGTARPPMISNGGDPSGVVFSIHWHNWGQPTASGNGLGWIYVRRRGYYPHPAPVELRAVVIGACPNSRAPAYLHLQVRYPTRPNAPYGPWFEWGGGPPMSQSTTCGVGRAASICMEGFFICMPGFVSLPGLVGIIRILARSAAPEFG